MAKILIIEDDENIASIEKDYLEINGYEVDIRNEAVSGIELANTGEYDLLGFDAAGNGWLFRMQKTEVAAGYSNYYCFSQTGDR